MTSTTKMIAPLLFALLFSALCIAQQQDQQNGPPLGDQSAYPSTTHKMSPAEKSNTPAANGQAVDLNSASKKDIAALPGVGPDLAQNIIDARPFRAKEDLLKKKLIPAGTFDQIKDLVVAGPPQKQKIH